MIPDKIRKWLNEQCPEEDIADKGGIKYLPIDACERTLDLMQDKFGVTWGTENYNSSLCEFGGNIWISASIELVITGDDHEWFEKRVVGCSTFRLVDVLPNTHMDATAKSLAVVNASMDLGDRFGRFLSKQNPIEPPTEKQKLKPDVVIQKQWENAVKNGDVVFQKKLIDKYEFDEQIIKA